MDVKVKVCGITNRPDAQEAVEAGADLLGFIFFPKSPRWVTPEQVRDILGVIRQANVLRVGVFVNESAQHIAQVLDFCGLDLAQLHGEEPPAVLGLGGGKTHMPRSPLRGRAYKAVRPSSLEEALVLAQRYALPPQRQGQDLLPAFLLDAYHPELRGGTGRTGDWQLAVSLAIQHPLLLAGGLAPANIAQAVRIVRPWGVDVASGVEKAPGQKDHAALRAFITAAKAA
jgi:phosphoribosylanthranilate isomerase